MTVPLSLTGKYQLVVLGQAGSSEVTASSSRLVNAVSHAFDQLGVNPRKFLIASTPAAPATSLDRRMLTVAVYFGLTPSPVLPVPDATKLTELLEDGILIVPVVENIANFSRFIPSEIAHLNGCSLADCGADFERLASRILEGFGLLREKRRLFISYRRVETSGIAAQLYEALDGAGFDVFLDTHVLRPGEPFQELLWHRLADTDIVLLLDSPEFLASRWTEEELARANNSYIQLLQILWPGQTEGATAAFSTFHPLATADFAGSNRLGPAALLTAACVDELVDEVEGLRARAVSARHAFLVREFAIEARKEGLTVFTTLERTLVLSAPGGGNRVLVMPAVGVPDAERYETLERLHQREVGLGRTYTQPPVLLYDQTGIRSRWLQHLGWLNDNIAAARSLSITDAKAWLSDLKASGSR